jgi:chromosome segregation ATPase
MSKAAKQSIFILMFLLLGSLGFTGYIVFEKQKVAEEKVFIENQLRVSEEKEREQSSRVAQLNTQLKQIQDEKQQIESRLRLAQQETQEMSGKITGLEQETERWKDRVDKVSEERNTLVSRLDQVNRELQDARKKAEESARKADEATAAIAAAKVSEAAQSSGTADKTAGNTAGQQPYPRTSSGSGSSSVVDEQYWASLLKEKASLEIALENLRSQLSESSIEMVELKQTNATLTVELDELKAAREDIEREIKYKNDLVNNLSLELARAKNNTKFVSDQLEKISGENNNLRDQVKRLVSSKSALEKSIVRVSKDKDKMSKQLEQSENLIQGKINEIWDIKESLDQTFKSAAQDNKQSSTEVMLPPIVVSAAGRNAVPFDPGMGAPGFDGKVVSLNQNNNFVIVDIGENDGLRLGSSLSVYRDSKYIARLEVIQVRKDISAADIKDQWSKIQVGDVVR